MERYLVAYSVKPDTKLHNSIFFISFLIKMCSKFLKWISKMDIN